MLSVVLLLYYEVRFFCLDTIYNSSIFALNAGQWWSIFIWVLVVEAGMGPTIISMYSSLLINSRI